LVSIPIKLQVKVLFIWSQVPQLNISQARSNLSKTMESWRIPQKRQRQWAICQVTSRTETTQKSHFCASILAYVKFEALRLRHDRNHFALKERLYLNAMQAAYQNLKQLDTIHVFKAA